MVLKATVRHYIYTLASCSCSDKDFSVLLPCNFLIDIFAKFSDACAS
jgi:hypothetical protein